MKAKTIAALRAEVRDLNNLFDAQWKSDMRAIKRWQEAHPGNDHVWPDRTDLVVWLMRQLDKHRKKKR
jgi:hypothetical protein